MKRFTKNSQAFTLVETLVAIAILMISISGPLAVANKALTAALYAKDQSTASFLAQEEMEVIKNIKDNTALADPSDWIGYFGSCANGPADMCELSIANNSGGSLNFSSIGIIISGCDSGLGCKLHATDYGYDSNAPSSPSTIFYRYFYLTPLSDPGKPNYGNEYQATVVVSWNEGTIKNAVTMQSELLNVAP